MKHLSLACTLALVACRRSPPPRDASRQARPAAAPSVAPQPTPPRSATLDVRDLTPWRDAAPGIRWRSAELRVVSVSPETARESTAPEALRWVVVRVDVARVDMRVERSPDDSITALWERDPTAIAVLDGAYFEPDHSPSGLVYSGGVAVAPVGRRGGSGILRVTRERADLVAIDARDGGTWSPGDDVTLALQCGPRVIEPGGVAGIHRHDGRFAARTVACVRDAGRTLDLIATWDVDDARRGPELHDLATVLSGPSPTGDDGPCESALNLDGGPSTGVYVRSLTASGEVRHAPVGPTPWAIVVRPRRSRESW